MVARYPNDVVFDVNAYSVTGQIIYNNTASSTTFVLSNPVDHRGEVLAFADGILQDTSIYSLVGNDSINFFVAPSAIVLQLKSVSVPSSLVALVTSIDSYVLNYSNTPLVVGSNTFTIDGATTEFAIPLSSNPLGESDLLIAINGLTQANEDFVYPSAGTLGSRGFDVTPAVPSNNTIDIRIFDSASTSFTDRCSTLIEKKPDKGFSVSKDFTFSQFESQVGYKKTRLISRKPNRTWNFKYTNVNGLQKDAIETFQDSRFGGFETFELDLSHLLDPNGGIVRVKFAAPIINTLVASKGVNLIDQFYTVSIRMQEQDD